MVKLFIPLNQVFNLITGIRMKTLKLLLLVLICSWCLSTVASNAQETADADAKGKIENIKLSENPGFKYFIEALKMYANTYEPNLKGKNNFYVTTYQYNLQTIETSKAYILWKEARRFLIFDIGDENRENWMGLTLPQSGANLHLDHDVVATVEEVGSSTYLVDQAWVNEKAFDALVNGNHIVLDL